jgi:hypothetical protein
MGKREQSRNTFLRDDMEVEMEGGGSEVWGSGVEGQQCLAQALG